jgi:hypothetical protein
MFTLTIETDNAAFTDNPGWEIARILRLISDSMSISDIPLDGDERQPVRDINGNTVGKWEYREARLEWECPRCHTINEQPASECADMTCVDCHTTV